ncbi:17202_t:CDS:2, partial [Gigaspora rosea]
YLTDASKLRTPPRSQADEISDNEKYLLSAECSDHDKDKIKLPEIIQDTPRNPFIGTDINKNSPIVTEHDLALVFRSIKPRNILPLLLAESNKKAHNDKDEPTINISIANTTNTTSTTETKGDSDNSSTKPTKKSDQSRKKCVTDYGKGTKRNYSKPIAIRKSKR